MFRENRWRASGWMALTLGLGALFCAPGQAQAQTPIEADQVDADFEGKVGCGLIGAELGLVTVGLMQVEETWPYLIGAGVGATGGAIFGHFVIDQNNEVDAGVAVMAVGIGLAVPALVFAAAASAYDPEDDDDIEVATASRRTRARASRRTKQQAGLAKAAQPASLVRYGSQGLALGVPSLSWLPMFTRHEQLRYGVKQQTEMRVALLSGSF
jgi:hypothetical protein